MACNKDRHRDNLSILHGWQGATFFTNGVAKTGESKIVRRTLHQAIFLPIETILGEAGLLEGTSRVPYDERHAAIKIVEQVGKPIVNHSGVVVGMEWHDVRE